MPDNATTIHCEMPTQSVERTACGEKRRAPCYPVHQFLMLCTLPQHEQFKDLCFNCISAIGDITDAAMEQHLSTGRVPR